MVQVTWSRTCIIGDKYIWVPKHWGALEPKYPQIVKFVFATLRVSIFMLAFVFGVLKNQVLALFSMIIGFVLGYVRFEMNFPMIFLAQKLLFQRKKSWALSIYHLSFSDLQER